jgi:hypothetical protein
MTSTTRQALIAAGLSLVVPGLGQFLHRAWVVGVFWMVMTVLFWYSSRSWLWFVPHLLASVSAYWGVQRMQPTDRRTSRKSRKP